MADIATSILQTAINEGRAQELLDCLFEGGSCTVDVITGRLVLVTEQQLKRMVS